jgi:hypothetical protein
MTDDPKIINKDGKDYCTLPDGSQALIENEIINDPRWISVQQAESTLQIGDRQIRNLAKKYNWDKKYAYINKKPVAFYLKSQLENFQRSRVTEVITASPTEETPQKEDVPNPETATTGKGLISKETIDEIDHVVKKLEPYIGDFLETYKKNQERIITLEEKKSSAENTAVFWKTTAIWIGVGGLIAFIAWFKADQINTSLNRTAGDLSSQYQNTQQELYNTKLLLTQKEDEVTRLQTTQTNSQTVNAAGPERK